MSDGFFPAYSPIFDIFTQGSLDGKATGTCYQSTTFDNMTIRAADVRIMVRLGLNGVTSAGGRLDLHLATGHHLGSSALTDSLATTTASGTAVYNIRYSTHIHTIDLPASSSPFVSWEASLLDLVGSMPPIWALILCNLSGAPFISGASNRVTGMFVNYGYA
mgnify:FL=1